ARRATRYANSFRVEIVFAGVAPEPANGGFAIMDCGWELIFGRQAISNCGGNETVLGEGETKFIVSLARTGAESAAMDAKHGGQRCRGGLRTGKIELQVLVIRVCVFDVALEHHVVRHDQLGSVRDPEHREEQHRKYS